ncbi:MAG: hypothetical protein ACI3XI_04365 [Eubacteriales bacterium]
MKKTILRIIGAALLSLMLISVAACAVTPAGPDETTTAPVASTTDAPESGNEETTSLNAENILGIRDFGGKTLTFYARSYNGVWSSDLVEDDDGTVIKSAVYKRNAKLTELYGVEFDEIESGKQSFLSDLGNRISTNDTSYQVLYMGLTDAANAAIKGYLLDMREIENINLDGRWWTQSSNKAWSFGGAQYFATGDITTIDDMAIRCMFFNKKIIEDHNLKTIYDLVHDNEWTFDKFFEYVEIAKKDDGDGKVTLSDTFGATAQTTFGFMMTMGTGEMLVGKDSNDWPVLRVATDNARFIDVVTYLTEKVSGNDGIYLGADEDIKQLFGNGQSLFYGEVLLHAQTMRLNFDINFGIVPMPKYNSDQDGYYQYTTGYCTTVICFPNTTKGEALDMSSFMVEAMAIESVETLTPAYYDVCLKGRYADDAESAEMLDIITTSVSSDLAEIYGWGGIKTAVQNAISSGDSISGIIKSNTVLTNKAIQNAIKDFKALKGQ